MRDIDSFPKLRPPASAGFITGRADLRPPASGGADDPIGAALNESADHVRPPARKYEDLTIEDEEIKRENARLKEELAKKEKEAAEAEDAHRAEVNALRAETIIMSDAERTKDEQLRVFKFLQAKDGEDEGIDLIEFLKREQKRCAISEEEVIVPLGHQDHLSGLHVGHLVIRLRMTRLGKIFTWATRNSGRSG